uniref:Glycosyltransferase RgtA/B/C/D-like domain-containing protein n=1 Tax=Ignisphaera aggregans TaxID=334771 RepID=A0A7J3Z944_9CREN
MSRTNPVPRPFHGRTLNIVKLILLILIAMAILYLTSTQFISIHKNLQLICDTTIKVISESLPKTLLGFINLAVIFVIGYVALRSLLHSYTRLLSTLELIVFSFTVGSGVIMIIMIILGTFYLISRLYVFTSLSILLIILSARLLQISRKEDETNGMGIARNLEKLSHSPHKTFKRGLTIPLFALFALAVHQAIAYPAVEWDSLAYGVNYARIIYENDGIPLIAGPSVGLEMSAAYPPGMQLIAVFLSLWSEHFDDFYYRILPPISGVLLALLLMELDSRLLSVKAPIPLISLLLLISTGLFWQHLILDSYIMHLSLMIFATMYLLILTLRTQDCGYSIDRLMILASLHAGFAALVSYFGLITLFSLIAYLLFAWLRGAKVDTKRVLVVLATFAFVACPWYLRNLMLLGNPLYPFFGIGKYLDPLLYNSTVLHFKSYKVKYAFQGFQLLLLDVVRSCNVTTLIYTFAPLPYALSKFIKFLANRRAERNSIEVFICLEYLVSLTFFIMIVVLHVPFPRYIVLFLPLFTLALTLSIRAFSSLYRIKNCTKVFSTLLAMFICVSVVASYMYMISVKNPPTDVNNLWDYLDYYFSGDASAWRVLNELARTGEVVATYDIREYYLKPRVVLLDGWRARGLYYVNDIMSALKILEDLNVKYILTTPSTTPGDHRVPLAYFINPITRHLGSDLFPVLYVSPSGATVYLVNYGGNGMQSPSTLTLMKDFVVLIPNKTFVFNITNITITNNTTPPSSQIYLAIPCDYRLSRLIISSKSYGYNISLEIFKGIIPEDLTTDWWSKYVMLARAPHLQKAFGERDPYLEWEVDACGYFTFKIVFWDIYTTKPINVDIKMEIVRVVDLMLFEKSMK